MTSLPPGVSRLLFAPEVPVTMPPTSPAPEEASNDAVPLPGTRRLYCDTPIATLQLAWMREQVPLPPFTLIPMTLSIGHGARGGLGGARFMDFATDARGDERDAGRDAGKDDVSLRTELTEAGLPANDPSDFSDQATIQAPPRALHEEVVRQMLAWCTLIKSCNSSCLLRYKYTT